jgi:hypothetical protein
VTPSAGIQKQEILTDSDIVLTFGADETAFGSVDCTGFTTTYQVDGASVDFGSRSGIETSPKFGYGAGACESDDVIAPLFFQLLDMFDRWAIDDGQLSLSSSQRDTPVAVFIAPSSEATASASPGLTPYAMSSFRAPFTVDARLMDTDWHEHLDRPNWVYLGWRPSSNEDEEGITFLYLDHLAVAPACGGPQEDAPWEPTGDGPSAFVDWLREAGTVSLGPIEKVTIGGHDGLQVDLATEALADCGGFLWVTHTEPDNGFQFLPGYVTRVIALDVDGATVLIVIGDAYAARFPGLAADAEELFDSISFS